MSSRWFAIPGVLALFLVGLAIADEPPAPQSPATKEMVKQALEAASSDDYAKAITILEKSLKTAPADRESLYLIAVMSTLRAEQVTAKDQRIALFHQGTAALGRLRKAYKEPLAYEKTFAARSQVGEARALALEGKPGLALAAIKQAMADGFDDTETIETEPDLESVRKLPELAGLLETAYQTQVAEEKKSVLEEMSAQKPFPFDFELKDTDGKTTRLADSKGKVTIVDVWGTWCPPCRKEIPHFVDLYKTFQPKGLQIVGINCNEEGSPEEVKKTIKDFLAKNKVKYPCVLNDDKTEAKIPGFQGYPTTLFLDKTGKVRLTLVGYSPKAKLEAIVSVLLAE